MRQTAIFTLASAAIGLAAPSTAAMAQSQPVLDNKQIEVAYIEPRKDSHRPIYERLKRRAVLEELKQFLAPLRLPPGRKLLVKIESCGGSENNPVAMYQNGIVTLCYEYIEWIRLLVPRETTPEGWRPEDAIVGPFVEVVLHGVAHAVFDLLDVPIWGRREDAADNLGGYIMWQFGKDVARRTLDRRRSLPQGAGGERKPLTKEDFADQLRHRLAALLFLPVHGLWRRRQQRRLRYVQGLGAELAAAQVPP